MQSKILRKMLRKNLTADLNASISPAAFTYFITHSQGEFVMISSVVILSAFVIPYVYVANQSDAKAS